MPVGESLHHVFGRHGRPENFAALDDRAALQAHVNGSLAAAAEP